jgi:hypothetical protein
VDLQTILADLHRYAADQTIYVDRGEPLRADTLALVAWAPASGPDRVAGLTPLIDIWHAREILAMDDRALQQAHESAALDRVELLLEHLQKSVW